MRDAVDTIQTYLAAHPMVDRDVPIRVRFFRLGTFSLDVEIFAYILAADWERFMETQQELLLGIMEVIERAGAELALPSQTLHMANTGAPAPASRLAAGHPARRGLSSELTDMTGSSVL